MVFICAATLYASLPVFGMLSDDEAYEAARKVLAQMTLEEKTMLLGGSGTMTLAAIPRVGISNEWTMSDNSSTVRPAMSRWGWDYAPPLAENTKLPSLSALAQTWDVAWARRHGEVLGAEMRARGVDELLGPGVNIARTPLNGRNWEYLGEDPSLASKMCVPMIRGIQSYDVAATVKHFCLNAQELNRTRVDTHVDARTLNEIYLPAFRAAVKEADVLCVMTSYNKVDGIWASENKYLQCGILRERWGFKGLIETDWGGQHSTAFAANNGGGVEMNCGQGIKYNYYAISNRFPLAEAVRANMVPRANVDEMALRTLYVMAKTGFLTGAPRKAGVSNTKEHQRIARAEGADSIVLLKNTKKLLPLAPTTLKNVLVIGSNADVTQCEKGCSGEGHVPYEVTLFAALTNRLPKAEVTLMPFCAKMEIEKTDTSAATIAGGHAEQKEKVAWSDPVELEKAARAADTVIVFTGTELGYQENMESESRDRQSMNLPKELEAAMHTILDWKLPRCIVVSRSGTPVGYTWTEKAEALVQTSYLGMEEGNAIVDVLLGEVNPSGRLCQSWPKTYADTAVAQCGTYNATNVVYNERFYVGYRWHDFKGIEPLFPFGAGSSYTTFAWSKATVEPTKTGSAKVCVTVTNTGKVAGRDVVQVYVGYPSARVERCKKDLRGFAKTNLLKPGESEIVTIDLTVRDFAYWDVLASRFRADKGTYTLIVAASSAEPRESVTFELDRDRYFDD